MPHNYLKEFAIGFVVTVISAAGGALLLYLIFPVLGAPSDVIGALKGAAILTLLGLVLYGGEIAFSFLFDSNIALPVKFMHFLGGGVAVFSAFFLLPKAIDGFGASGTKEECKVKYERRIGPISFSKKECEN